MKKDILQIAKQVRKTIERTQSKTRFWSKDLCGACAVASTILAERLIEAGFKDAKICIATEGFGSHCFVYVNKHIVDITATQFGLDKVCVVPIATKNRPWHWKPNKTIPVHKADTYFHDWMENQRPTLRHAL